MYSKGLLKVTHFLGDAETLTVPFQIYFILQTLERLKMDAEMD
jgi:hypothetical protein